MCSIVNTSPLGQLEQHNWTHFSSNAPRDMGGFTCDRMGPV